MNKYIRVLTLGAVLTCSFILPSLAQAETFNADSLDYISRLCLLAPGDKIHISLDGADGDNPWSPEHVPHGFTPESATSRPLTAAENQAQYQDNYPRHRFDWVYRLDGQVSEKGDTIEFGHYSKEYGGQGFFFFVGRARTVSKLQPWGGFNIAYQRGWQEK